MPQSLAQLYAHLVFSTKDRRPLLDADIRPRVHSYLASLMRDLDSSFTVVGGVADHVHILFEQNKLRSPAEVVKHIKGQSSKFIKTLGPAYQDFFWQRGYGMFSVSPTHRDDVEKYVRAQEDHHKHTTFQDEYRSLLDRYGLIYDEKFVWD